MASNHLAFLAPELREQLGRRLENLVINWPALLINSIAERLTPKGFTIPGNEALTDQVNDIWQFNGMDEQVQLGIIDKLVYGRSYGLVWGDEAGAAKISIESPHQMIAWRNPMNRRWEAAAKRWVEEDGYAYAFTYTPDQITFLKSRNSHADQSDLYGEVDQVHDLSHLSPNEWEVLEETPNPLGELPVVVIPNRPRILEPEGVSELADVLPLSDAINKLCTDMTVTAEFHARIRRWAVGIEIEEDSDGNEVDELEKSKGIQGWNLFENENAKVGQFEEATLQNFVDGVDMLVKYLSAIKKIPSHYMNPAQAGLASAEAVRASEAPLVVLAKRDMVSTGGALEQIARLALMVESGDLPSSNELRMETQWEDPENLTASQKIDAVSKKAALQVPVEQLWRDAGYTEQQIEDMKRMRSEEQAAAQPQEENNGSGNKPGADKSGKSGAPGGR